MKRHIYQAVYALIALLFTALPTQAAEEVTYYHNDQLGSPIAATDSAGTVLWQQAYDPWGYKLTSTTNERAYTGHWEDPDTGLSDYQARWYSPTIGRFTRMDPVVWNENNVKSFNRYAYANNSPYRYTDPDGNIPLDTIWDAGNVLWDIGKITVGAITGNGQLVADGTVDLIADSAALAVPYLPAGASKLTMLGDGLEDVADVIKNPMARGRASETRVLDDLGLPKNTDKVTTAEGNSVPDALTSTHSIEIKDCITVACTRQIRIQTDAARQSGRESVLITGESSHVTPQADRAFDRIIRRNDLGPQQ